MGREAMAPHRNSSAAQRPSTRFRLPSHRSTIGPGLQRLDQFGCVTRRLPERRANAHARPGARRARAAPPRRARRGSPPARRHAGRAVRRGAEVEARRGGRRGRPPGRRCPMGGGSGRDGDHRRVRARRSSAGRRAGRAGRAWRSLPRSALVTTSTSGISMIPDFRNCSASPEPGWTTTATVSAASATSVSDWPTPTVSMTTTSKACASACAAARVAGARPPSRSPAAIERMKTERSRGSVSIRARSPSSAPPERLEDGSTASTATERPRSRHALRQRAQQRRLARPRAAR